MSKLSLNQAKRQLAQDKRDSKLKKQQASLMIKQVYLQKQIDELQGFQRVVNRCKMSDVAIDAGFVALAQEDCHALRSLSRCLFNHFVAVKFPPIYLLVGLSIFFPVSFLASSHAMISQPEYLKQLIDAGAWVAFHAIFMFLFLQVIFVLWIFFAGYCLGLSILHFGGIENAVAKRAIAKFSMTFSVIRCLENLFCFKVISTDKSTPAYHYVKAVYLLYLERLLLARLDKLQHRLNKSQLQIYMIGEKLNGDNQKAP